MDELQHDKVGKPIEVPTPIQHPARKDQEPEKVVQHEEDLY